MKKIDELKQLCYEHDRMIRLKDMIRRAKGKQQWMQLLTPERKLDEGEQINYDGDFIVDAILKAIDTRIKEIEKISESEGK